MFYQHDLTVCLFSFPEHEHASFESTESDTPRQGPTQMLLNHCPPSGVSSPDSRLTFTPEVNSSDGGNQVSNVVTNLIDYKHPDCNLPLISILMGPPTHYFKWKSH